jgi:uncharacterized tellurite resistance protein B-like protein
LGLPNTLPMKTSLTDELKSHFLNLYSLAQADTQVDTTELEQLFKIGEGHGVTKKEIEDLILNRNNIKIIPPKDTLTKVEFLYDFSKIILADGVVDDREKEMLKKFCINFGFEDQNIPIIMEYLIEEAKKGTDKKTIIEQVKQTL